ncbi:MAG: hypothetical protein DI556_19870 [Rhodovulum sulfidophilum]|uniref:YjiS-like domain-containing protein n=1 Tax=Rhodovulum sulfidophilum TaxID=35806 RepID=A0A2W5MZA0_RHOSU|nr:MAG: hypothetical protein DI556_19870 [Rhodovulum sulfidophilum]
MTTAYANPHVSQRATIAETGDAGGIRGLIRAAQAYLAYRRTLAELRTLSPRELADLGISRFALPSIAREAVRAL